MTCPGRKTVDRYFSGSVAPAGERQMRSHLETCESCRQHYDHHLLLAELDPRAETPKERLRRGLGLQSPPRPAHRRLPFGLGIAAAAAVLAIAVVQIGPPEAGDEFAARGNQGVLVGPQILVYQVSAGGDADEVTGTIRPDAELALAYDNPTEARWLMVFATGDDDRVFWYYPAWTDAADNPSAIAIEAGRQELPEAIAHSLPEGKITLHALFLDGAVSVRDVETALHSSAPLDAVHHVERTLTVTAE